MNTVRDVLAFKERGERFAMLTAYDFPSARLVDAAGIPVILVGDSLGMVVLGHSSTLPVTVDDMIHHTAAVARGAGDALVVADMPFMSYQASLSDGVSNAGRLIKEGAAHAVKVEGGARVVPLVALLVESGIPVVGHLGLTPQSVNQLGGYRVQGRRAEEAHAILQAAKDLESAGAFAVVLEAVPADLAQEVTTGISIPTIGIGAGPHCDGQVLVWHDLLGLGDGPSPRFVKRYASLGATIAGALRAFAADVSDGAFPDADHSYL